MNIFQHKKLSMLIVVALLFVGFCAGVVAQRTGIPKLLKQLVLKSDTIYAPITEVEESKNKGPYTVWIREFPYPYKAALAIASDIDYCPKDTFNEIHRFLNTNEMTSMGLGLDLDIADSMFMYDVSDSYGADNMPPAMSYWKGVKPGTVKDAELIRQYINKGWIDSLHSYGNFDQKNPFHRELAVAAIKELSSQKIFLDTWINHGGPSITNDFGQYYRFPSEQGDVPNSPAYHTDLTIAYGVRYAWGQTRQEFGTKVLAVPLKLRDGRSIWNFSRYHENNNFAKMLHLQLSEHNLKKLSDNGLWEIVANHFGAPTPQGTVRIKTHPTFGPEARNALRRLAYEFRRGNILVLRTSRLLKYYVVSKHLKWEYDVDNDCIYIEAIDDPVLGRYVPTIEDLRGVTFYFSKPGQPSIMINQRRLPQKEVVKNPHDGVAYSISIKPYFVNP